LWHSVHTGNLALFLRFSLNSRLHKSSKMAMAAANRGRAGKLAPEVNKILYIKNLPYKITAEEMYDIFGKFGAIRQIRM
jgi:RNA recognition motif-containing protein